jgi:hypothetical protein
MKAAAFARRFGCRTVQAALVSLWATACAQEIGPPDTQHQEHQGGNSGGGGGGEIPIGSCNPRFCTGATGVACCVGPNGPCGIDQGSGCVEVPAGVCEEQFCPAQFGAACCASGTSPCGEDLGLGCTVQELSDGPEYPAMVDGRVNLYGACGLPPDKGPCDASETRYAWVPALRTCAPFAYGGCEGNGNRFETLAECLDACGDLPRFTKCICTPEGPNCSAGMGCSTCPVNPRLVPGSGDLSCTSLGLVCDSGDPCGAFCECVAGSSGPVWACASRIC